MSYRKSNAQEDKDVESVSDSPGRTLEPLQSHTFSLKNNAAGLSSDEHENPLNGTQPNPFVYSSVPAVPHAGNSLPSGALVNGPGSHPTSEVHCVLNKGTVLSNSVLDAAWQAEKDTSPEVLPPPSELQSDAWKNTAGPVVKTLATQPGVNTPLSHSEENESKLACSTLSGDSAEQMHISQPLTKQTIKTRSQRDVERSGSSSDDYDNTEVIKWHSARECFFHSDRRLETKVMHQRGRTHNRCTNTMSGCLEKVNNSYRHFCSSNDVENVDSGNKDESLGTQSDIKYSVMPFKDLSRNTALDSEHHMYSTAQEGCNEENDPEDETSESPKVEQLKTEQLEQDPLFFSCTICNVNFKEKRHFHRHMMYHLGKHNQVNSENDSQPFICRKCGRLFCDSNSLMRHIIIHQDRLEKLMEQIKGFRNSEIEDMATTAPCPHCAFACNCPKILVRHAKTHDNLKHYYFCEECNYITLTQRALEAHLNITHRPQYRRMTHTNDVEGAGRDQFQCKMGFFTSGENVELERHSEVERSFLSDYKKFPGKLKIPRYNPPNLFALEERDAFSCCSPTKGEFFIQKSNNKTINSSQQCVGSTKTTLSPSLWRIDKHGKLLRQAEKKLEVETDLTCVEEDAEINDCKPFGSTKQANHPVILVAAKNLKLDQMFCQNDPPSGSLQVRADQNSPSTLKMSTPLHNTIGNMNGNILPRLSQRLKKQCVVRKIEKDCEGGDNLSDDTSEATGSCLEGSKNERNPYARRYFRKRQSFSAKHQSPHTLKDEDDGDEDCSDIEQLIIKEEYIESMTCDDSSELPVTSPGDSFDVSPIAATEHKPCPYCPASFESGVGLANHVRGHLHRVGLNYNARHMLSPEQVALRDCKPRFRRRINAGMRRLRKAVKTETHREHTCPLCLCWFDTKTGLSNHVRGHLRRIGRSVTSTNKSPLCILKELLQDKKEHWNILQLLNKSHFLEQHSASQKITRRNGLFLMRTGIPVKGQHGVRSPHPTPDRFVLKQEGVTFLEQKHLQVEAQRDAKASPSTLFKLLQTKEESSVRHDQENSAARMMCDITKEDMEETEMTSVQPSWIQGYDYKQKKPRPRPGLKKKILPSLNTEICTLTCRFCDLVFHGPLSIQEDWIKHLQRHLQHTSVPHSGTAMVEVLGLHHRMQISMFPEHPGV